MTHTNTNAMTLPVPVGSLESYIQAVNRFRSSRSRRSATRAQIQVRE